MKRKKIIIVKGGSGVGKTTAASYIESTFGFPSVPARITAEKAFRQTFCHGGPIEFGTPAVENFQKFQRVMKNAFGSLFWAKSLDEWGYLTQFPGITVVEGDIGPSFQVALEEVYDVLGTVRILRGDQGDFVETPGLGTLYVQNPCPWPHSNNRTFFKPFMDNVLEAVRQILPDADIEAEDAKNVLIHPGDVK